MSVWLNIDGFLCLQVDSIHLPVPSISPQGHRWYYIPACRPFGGSRGIRESDLVGFMSPIDMSTLRDSNT